MSLPLLSGRQIVKILVKEFSFVAVRQKGSHIALSKLVAGHKILTVVPNHKQVARGTLRGIIKLAKITEEDFLSAIKK